MPSIVIGDGTDDGATAGLATVIVVTADCDTVAVNRRIHKTRAGYATRVGWRATERVRIPVAGD
jgi:hypothetical protein